MNIFKKIVMLMLSLFLVLSTVQYASAASNLFTDVSEKTSVYKELQYLVDKGIVEANADQAYGVKSTATRYDVAYIIVKALQLEVPTEMTTSPYTDIAIDDERLPYIIAIANANIMNGYEDQTFKPDATVSRSQVANILVKAFNLKGTSSQTFKDVGASHHHFEAISIFIANKVTAGYANNLFKPTEKITKGHLAAFIARILNPAFRVELNPVVEEISCVKPTNKSVYRVDVAVANFWHDYNKYRKVDAPSLTNPVNYDKWVPSMTLAQKKWLVGQTDTQALYNDEVTLIKTKGDMAYVAAKDQYVPYNKNGYPGWVGKNQVVKTNYDASSCSIAVVTAKRASLLNEKNKTKFLEISYATILPVIKKENGYYYVQTPANGVKLLKTTDAAQYNSYAKIPKPSKADIVNTAKRYLGLKYLWSGLSSWGYDCSGIIYAAYRAHGIMIPRDSFYQATKGTIVAKKNLQAGDLVFFAYNGGKGKVYHVGLYIGDGKMLHAPHYASQVKIENLDSGVYKRNYAGARRYLN